MVFSSLFFIFAFLPVTLLIYYLVPRRYSNHALLLCSLVFYAWGEPVYVVLMILNIAFNYVMGLQLEMDYHFPRRARRNLIFTLIVDLGLLGVFKYYGFVVTNLNRLLPVDLPVHDIGLPIGISFYTFQVLSYIIDIYQGKIQAQKDPVKVGVYITMFPQLIAGPIVQYSDIEEQLQRRDITFQKFSEGAGLFIIGLSKKVLLANSVGAVFDTLSGMGGSSMSVLTGWLTAISYSFQIYFDFSGYSDMAIGLGKMLGFDFRPNFDYPYISKSATEFWRRWHMSLGAWFRDYVYIPLGGNQVSSAKHIRNILVVWMLTGMWHGAAWNFILWGLYYGVILLIEKYYLSQWASRIPGILKHIYTMIVVMIGWVFFSSTDLSMCTGILGAMFGFGRHALVDSTGMYYLAANLILGGIMACASTPIVRMTEEFFIALFPKATRVLLPILYLGLFILCIAYLVNETYNPFLYFRF